MKVETEKSVTKQSRAVADASPARQGKKESEVQFEDSRPRVVGHRELAGKADSSPQAGRIAQLQAMVDGSAVGIVQKQGIDEEELMQGKFETVQRAELEEEELLQGKFETIQKVEEEEELQMKSETIQKKRSEKEEIQTKNAMVQIKNEKPANNTGLPDKLKSGVENLSGLSLDDVKVHYNSPKPAQLQAHAFAQGTDIHMAPGQEKHLPHEAWHVVQQKQGRVKPTRQLKGKVNVNENAGLEKEADVMGAKAQTSAAGAFSGLRSQGVQRLERPAPSRKDITRGAATVQLEKIKVKGGLFEDTGYKAYDDGKSVGAEMGMLKFTPKPDLDADEVHLVQIVKERQTGSDLVAESKDQGNVGHEARVVKEGEYAGWAVDAEPIGKIDAHMGKVLDERQKSPEPGDKKLKKMQVFDSLNKEGVLTSRDPRYAQQRTEKKTPAYAPGNPPNEQSTGYATVRKGIDRFKKARGAVGLPPLKDWMPSHAGLRDKPGVPKSNKKIEGMEFETTALATGGKLDGMYIGSVLWGWTRSPGDKALPKLDKLTLNTEEGQSGAVAAAAAEWNKHTVGGKEMMHLPVDEKKK